MWARSAVYVRCQVRKRTFLRAVALLCMLTVSLRGAGSGPTQRLLQKNIQHRKNSTPGLGGGIVALNLTACSGTPVELSHFRPPALSGNFPLVGCWPTGVGRSSAVVVRQRRRENVQGASLGRTREPVAIGGRRVCHLQYAPYAKNSRRGLVSGLARESFGLEPTSTSLKWPARG